MVLASGGSSIWVPQKPGIIGIRYFYHPLPSGRESRNLLHRWVWRLLPDWRSVVYPSTMPVEHPAAAQAADPLMAVIGSLVTHARDPQQTTPVSVVAMVGRRPVALIWIILDGYLWPLQARYWF